METQTSPPARSVTDGIIENQEQGLLVLTPADRRPFRRIVYLDNYGGAAMWEKIKQGEVPPHHLRGCLELARMGYEVALAEPIPDFVPRHPFPHDLKLLRLVRSWLGGDGIVFCGHNVLYWIPFLRALHLLRARVVSNLWARETLDWAGAHSGIITLTPAGAEQARQMAPKAKIANLGWGADLDAFPQLPYRPEFLLHCGIAGRDFKTLGQAAARSGTPVEVIGSFLPEGLDWPPNVRVLDGGRTFNFQQKKISFHDLLYQHYALSAGSLVITQPDPKQTDAFGCTNVIEAMAMGQPIILTRTGALPDEVNVERDGFGFEVPPQDVAALAKAMAAIMSDRNGAEEMGRNARKVAESRFNIVRYAAELHKFFESL